MVYSDSTRHAAPHTAILLHVQAHTKQRPRISLFTCGLLTVACTALASGCSKPSNLQTISKEVEEEGRRKLKVMQAALPQLPVPTDYPAGVPPERWADVHWFPADAIAIAGAGPAERPPFSEWLFSQTYSDGPACLPVKQGFISEYNIEGVALPKTFVFYLNADLQQTLDCAIEFTSRVGGTAKMEGRELVIELDRSKIRVQFARRGEQLVAIANPDRVGPIADILPNRLAANQFFVQSLDTAAKSDWVWQISTQDMTSGLLGVASRGYTMTMAKSGRPWQFRVSFANEADAVEAKLAVAPLVEAVSAQFEIDVEVQAETLSNTLIVNFDLVKFMSSLKPGDIEAITQKMKGTAI